MIDLIAEAEKINKESTYEVEALQEFILSDIAEANYAKNKDWEKAYALAAKRISNCKENADKLQNSYPKILAVDDRANIMKVSKKYFLKIMAKKDPKGVVQAFINIGRIYENRKPEYSKWAKVMAATLVNDWNSKDNSCMCIVCGYTGQSPQGVDCQGVKCPNCNIPLFRERPRYKRISLPSEEKRQLFLKEKREHPFDNKVITPQETPELKVKMSDPMSLDEAYWRIPFTFAEVKAFTSEEIPIHEMSSENSKKLFLLRHSVQTAKGADISDEEIKTGLENAKIKPWAIELIMP